MFCFDGMIDISLSTTHANPTHDLSVMLIPMLLEPHFCSVVPKLEVTTISHFLRKSSVGLIDAVVKVVVIFGVVADAFTTSADFTIGAVVLMLNEGANGTIGFLTTILLLIVLLVDASTGAEPNNVPLDSINAIGSIVLCIR
jgi:hypothetical protein